MILFPIRKNDMHNSPEDSLSSDQRSSQFGLLAFGRAKVWEISINEAMSGPERWFAQIESPSLYLHFEIHSPAIMCHLLNLLRPKLGSRTEDVQNLEIGNFNGLPVTVLCDNETADRRIILIGKESDATLRLSLAGNDLADFFEAIRQITEDLDF
jgi:hypothetical protein